jgi:hypothetical protein
MIVKIRCVKNGYNITKGKLYDIEVYNHVSSVSEYLTYKSGIYITDDKGGSRYYLSEYFIDVEDKQTWRDLQLEELI